MIEDLADLEELGPVDYVIIEFPGRVLNPDLAPELVRLVRDGTVEILDMLVLHKDADGVVTTVELDEAAQETGILASLPCDLPGLLTDEDIAVASAAIEPGTSAGFLIWENTWAAPFARSVRRSGGVVAASGRIPLPELIQAIEAIDAAGSGGS
jgi:hypothetical protein